LFFNLGKGLREDTFRAICDLWKQLGYGEKSENTATLLMLQLLDYSLGVEPYHYEFDPTVFNVEKWWLMCRQKNNYIQHLALMINSTTPYNASCERIFSVLGWYANKRRTK